jgi:16S rRNA processing protein RimM
VASPLILMGVVGRPHGVRGLVRVVSYTERPEDLAAYSPLTDERGRLWHLAWKGEGIAELRDASGRSVADRDAAAALTNLRLHLPRERLPAPAAEEFYVADLVGLAALDPSGAPLGTVRAVHDYGAGCSLEIERPGAPPLLLPFTRACVPEVDIAGGRVVAVPPHQTDAREDAA